MRFFRLAPIESRLDSPLWRRSTEQRECCIAACCEPGARHAASLLFRTETVPDEPEAAVSPWLLPPIVACAALAEVPAVTTDPRLTAAQRAALQQGRPIEVPALAAPDGARPALQAAAEAKLLQALSAVAEAFRAVGQPEAGQRMLASFTQAWSEATARDAPAAAPAATGGRTRRIGAAGHPGALSPGA